MGIQLFNLINEKTAIVILLFYLILFSCNKKVENKGNGNVVCGVTRWENGNIKSEGCFVNDTIKEGLFKRYYRSGKLELEANYHKNKENGCYIIYFESGKKHFELTYKNGLRSGIGIEYYENGLIKEYRVYKIYNHKHKGESGFEIDYLEDGSIKEVLGAPLVDLSVNKDTLDLGDTLRIDFIVATPKDSKVEFQFYKDVTAKQDREIIKVYEKEGYGYAKYSGILNKRGSIKWGGTLNVKFNNPTEKEVKFNFAGYTIVK